MLGGRCGSPSSSPVFNEPGRLARTLARRAVVRRRSRQRHAVFLVDDGSDAPIDAAEYLPGAHAGVPGRPRAARGESGAGGGARDRAAARAGGAFPVGRLRGPRDHGRRRAAPGGGTWPLKLAAAIDAGADVALGDRFQGDSNVPPIRRALVLYARIFERALTGLRLSDAHNGLRAFSRRAVEGVQIHQNRMAHATEITRQISVARAARALVVVEVPVSVRYTRETLRKGQTSLGAFAILRDLFYRYLFEEAE